MPHFVTLKKQIKTDILTALGKAGSLDLSKTIAEFSLNSGFTEKTVGQIVEQMQKLDYIIVEGNAIKRPNAKPQERSVPA